MITAIASADIGIRLVAGLARWRIVGRVTTDGAIGRRRRRWNAQIAYPCGGRIGGRAEFVRVGREGGGGVRGRRRLADVAVQEGGHRRAQLRGVVSLLVVCLRLGRGQRRTRGASVGPLPRRRRHGQALHRTDWIMLLLLVFYQHGRLGQRSRRPRVRHVTGPSDVVAAAAAGSSRKVLHVDVTIGGWRDRRVQRSIRRLGISASQTSRCQSSWIRRILAAQSGLDFRRSAAVTIADFFINKNLDWAFFVWPVLDYIYKQIEFSLGRHFV